MPPGPGPVGHATTYGKRIFHQSMEGGWQATTALRRQPFCICTANEIGPPAKGSGSGPALTCAYCTGKISVTAQQKHGTP
jgi:hypothetical protein